MNNSKKIILDLCGGTGAWSKPYLKAGYDVRLITLPENDVGTFVPPKNVYGVLAAPPCTMFSRARTNANKERNLREGMDAVRACLKIIWECRYEPLYKKDGALKFWALENPFGILRQFLGKPAMTFDPCDFGEPYTKKTDLWGYFNNPKTNKIELSQDTKQRCKNNLRELPVVKNSSYAARRAITPDCFASAFFKANK